MEFQDLCANMGLNGCPSNALNPQSNAILEWIHQVLADGLVTFDFEGTPIDLDEEDLFDEYLIAVLYAIRSSFHQPHGHSPAQLVFGQGMFLPVSTEVDWNATRNNKQIKVMREKIPQESLTAIRKVISSL